MNILLLNTSRGPGRYGVERWMHNLGRALLELIGRPERRQAMGAAARHFSAANFSMDVAIQKFMEIVRLA